MTRKQAEQPPNPNRSRRPVLVSIPMDRCVKNFLDTDAYQALRDAHPICVFSYLSDQVDFRQTYGGPDVRFFPAPQIQPGWRWRLFNLADALRFFGFLFRFRKGYTRTHWIGQTWYHYPADYVPRPAHKRRGARHTVFWVIGWIGSTFRLDRILARLFGDWFFENPAVDDFFRSKRPIAYVATANRTEQEKVLAHYARKYHVFSILLPDSWDNFGVDGFFFHQFDRICVMGPTMGKQLRELHQVPPDRLADLGVPLRRMYEALAESGHGFDLRMRYGIAPEKRIITFIAVSRVACFDTKVITDYLADRIDDGTILQAVLLLRTQPGEDATDYLDRYRNRASVRVQPAGNKGGGGTGAIRFLVNEENVEYVQAIREAAVVVSGLSACVMDACGFDVPVVVPTIELSRYPPGGFSPRTIATVALTTTSEDIWSAFDRADSLEELVDRINTNLANPTQRSDARRRLMDRWDYKRPDYVPRFLELIPQERNTGSVS